MEAYQKRVEDEFIELHAKRIKLEVFLGNPERSQSIPEEEIRRLRRQLDIMIQYESILQERIDNFR